jgi:hypothetical protein
MTQPDGGLRREETWFLRAEEEVEAQAGPGFVPVTVEPMGSGLTYCQKQPDNRETSTFHGWRVR